MARPLHEKGAIKPLAKAFPAKSISAIAEHAIRQQFPSLNNRLDNPVLWQEHLLGGNERIEYQRREDEPRIARMKRMEPGKTSFFLFVPIRVIRG
jgi:hypothetical protein